MRALKAYAKLNNKCIKDYALHLVLDGVVAEAHDKIDLRQIPEIEARVEPKKLLLELDQTQV